MSTLQDHLRDYERSVNIPPGEESWANQIVTNCMTNGILKYIRENATYITSIHYTGSSYEGLKTQHADEFDIMVQVKHKEVQKEWVKGVPGYAVMVPKTGSQDPFYHKLLEDDKIAPMSFLNKEFFSLVQKAVNFVGPNVNPIKLKISRHGPAVQVDIITPGPGEMFPLKTISVDLVLCYMFDEKNHFVAKPFKEYADDENAKRNLPCKTDLLWRQSFSLREKQILQKMDRDDQGCRHRCVRIIKTIFRNDSTLKKLTSYHIKTAFLKMDPSLRWNDSDLSDRFLDILSFILKYIREREMPHYFVPDMNLLDGFKESTMNNIQGRLERLIRRLTHSQYHASVFIELKQML